MKTRPQSEHTHSRRDFLRIAGASALVTGLAAGPQASAKKAGIKGFSCIPLNFGREMGGEKKTMSYEDWIRMAVEFGLDGTEIYQPFIRDRDAADRARLADFMHEAGLKASMFTIESNFCNPADREKTTAHVKASIDSAPIFEANIVRVVSGHGSEGLEHELVLQSIADGLRGCLDYAEEKQVMLAYEDHWGIGTNVRDFMRILELVDDDRLKVNLDTANVGSKDIVKLTKLVVDRIVHVHVSELLNNRHGFVIGKGEVDFDGVFKVLKSNGYDSWISLEPLTGGKEDLRFSVNHIKDVWNKA